MVKEVTVIGAETTKSSNAAEKKRRQHQLTKYHVRSFVTSATQLVQFITLPSFLFQWMQQVLVLAEENCTHFNMPVSTSLPRCNLTYFYAYGLSQVVLWKIVLLLIGKYTAPSTIHFVKSCTCPVVSTSRQRSKQAKAVREKQSSYRSRWSFLYIRLPCHPSPMMQEILQRSMRARCEVV